MNIKLVFVDGSTMTVDKRGYASEITDSTGRSIPELIEGNYPDVSSVWHETNDVSLEWDEVVQDMLNGDFYLENPSVLYLDNGQVIDEGKIVRVELREEDRAIIYEQGVEPHDGSTGGCDTSGWRNTDANVYCITCDTPHKVTLPEPDDRVPSHCSLCGSGDILLREDN